MSGEHRPAAAYAEQDGRITVPLELSPCGSTFVVFREPAARLLADHEATRADIRLGSLSIRQQMSPAMAGRTATVQLLDWQRRSAPASPRLRADAVIGNTGTLAVFLAAIPPGLYAVTVTPEHGERVWLSSTGDPLRPDSVAVAVASDDVTVATGNLSARAVTVHQSFRRVFSEVAEFFPLLAVFDPDSNIVVYTGIDPGSRFRFDLFATRSFRLRISEGGLDRWVGGSGFHDATEFTVSPGAGDMELPPLSECGIVLDLVPPTPGMPVEPRLVIMDAAGKQTAWHPPFTHASRIPIPNLVPGAYPSLRRPDRPGGGGMASPVVRPCRQSRGCCASASRPGPAADRDPGAARAASPSGTILTRGRRMATFSSRELSRARTRPKVAGSARERWPAG